MKRIAIVGCGGAGKSTLARRLGSLLGIEVIHLDSHFWRPGWIETPAEEWAICQRDLLERETWIADGNYGGSFELRFAPADTILFLDLPRRVCLWRVLRRWLVYAGRSRPDVPPGCREKIDLEFLRWIWQFPRRSRPHLVAVLERHREGRQVEVLRSGREVARFLDSLAEPATRHGAV